MSRRGKGTEWFEIQLREIQSPRRAIERCQLDPRISGTVSLDLERRTLAEAFIVIVEEGGVAHGLEVDGAGQGLA